MHGSSLRNVIGCLQEFVILYVHPDSLGSFLLTIWNSLGNIQNSFGNSFSRNDVTWLFWWPWTFSYLSIWNKVKKTFSRLVYLRSGWAFLLRSSDFNEPLLWHFREHRHSCELNYNTKKRGLLCHIGYRSRLFHLVMFELLGPVNNRISNQYLSNEHRANT